VYGRLKRGWRALATQSSDDLLELVDGHASHASPQSLGDGAAPAASAALHVAGEDRLERLLLLPSGCCGARRLHAVEQRTMLESTAAAPPRALPSLSIGR
jgi:hypothetical protein